MAQETPPPIPRRGPLPRLLAAPVVLAAIVLAAYLATRPLGGGEPQPSFFIIGSAVPGVQIGQLAPGSAQAGPPDLPLAGIDGEPIALTEFQGRPIWIVFWKTACPPCEAEASDVAAARAAHGNDDLAVIGIDVWDTAAAVREYAVDHELPIPIAIALTSAVTDAYGIWGAPTHYFIDRAGIIRDRYFGPMTRGLIDKSLGKIL